MIQRIQSVFLLLTSLMSILFLSGNYFMLNNPGGTGIFMDFTGIWRSSGAGEYSLIEKNYILTTVAIMIAVISLTTIFFYRNRKLQIKFVTLLIFTSVVMIGLSAFYIFTITKEYSVSLKAGFRLIIPPLVFLSSLMALRGIRKDEDLVRSYDRLR